VRLQKRERGCERQRGRERRKEEAMVVVDSISLDRKRKREILKDMKYGKGKTRYNVNFAFLVEKKKMFVEE